MKYGVEDLANIAEDASGSIQMAIDELIDVEVYSDIKLMLEEAKSMLDDKADQYQEEYEKEQQKELDFLNREYERSKIEF